MTRSTSHQPSRERSGLNWSSLATNLGLSALSIAIFVGVVEAGLRLTGFTYVLVPQEIEFGKPDPILLETGFSADEDLFWVTKDYPAKLDRLKRERPPLILMGDSCTHLGRYDEALADLVSARHGQVLRFGNVGVAGWSTYQGFHQLERDIVDLAPAVVTLYYGWNDHWIGFGIEDKNVALVRKVFGGRWSQLRVVQLATKATVAFGARETAYPNRVSLDDFENNLRGMIAAARTHGIKPLLVTAATSHREGHEPEALGLRWLRDLSELIPLHQSYIEAVRRIAEETESALCDTAADFADLPRAEIERSFLDDGIHLTAEGDQRLAGMLYTCLEEQGLLNEILN